MFAVNPLQAARYRERHAVPGAKSDTADAHMLADMVRTDAHQLRQVAADSPGAQAVKVVARAHKTLIWERSRQVHRLRYQLRDFFPAALEACDSLGLDAADVLELLAKAPDPASAAKLTTAQVSAALKRGHRRHVSDKTAVIRQALRSAQLSQPSPGQRGGRRCRACPGRGHHHCSTSRSRCWRVRWRRIFFSTRTLRSSCPSPGWDRSSAPGCWPNSVTTRHGMPAPKPARTVRIMACRPRWWPDPRKNWPLHALA